jgi:hypothetical protein
MELFDNIERTYQGPKSETESSFTFVNRSAQPLFSKTRELVQEWFDDVSADGDDKKDMRARFRSDDGGPHVGAFFELYCHGLLRYQGFDVMLHQNADTTTSRVPDFSVSKAGKDLFHLESTLAADTFMEEKSQARLNAFLEDLKRLDSPNYGISIDYDEGPQHQPSGKKARRFLEEKLERLEKRAAKARSWRSGDGIVWEYGDHDWTIRFSPILRRAEVRGKPGQTLILMASSGAIVAPDEPLYDKIKKKATPYGKLTQPYIVAVDTMDDFAGQEDVVGALLGKMVYRVDQESRRAYEARDPKFGAAFLSPQGKPTNTRVSAVLVGHIVTMGRLATSETPKLWHNPWAQNPLALDIWQGPQISIDPNTYQIEEHAGLDYHDYLRKRLDYQDW